MTRRSLARLRGTLLAVALALVAAPGLARGADAPAPPDLLRPMSSPAGNLPVGPRANGTAVLPDGRFVTPVGKTTPVGLLPLNLVVSHDGKRVYVSSEGGDDQPTAKEHVYNRFITVLDSTTLHGERVADDALQYGLAESPDGRQLYVSEGEKSTVGVFSVGAGGITRTGSVGLQAGDFPWGMALSPNGRYAYVAGFVGNSLSVVDTRTRQRVGRVDTGEFPYTVAVSPDGTRAYVTNWGLYNPQADDVAKNAPVDVPPLTIGGYNTDNSSSVWIYDLTTPVAPTVINRVRIGPAINGYDIVSGSLPSSMALSPDGKTLAVTASNTDTVVLLDARTGATVRTIDLRVFGPAGPTGSQPNAVAWSKDAKVLYVAEGGRNSVALVDPRRGFVNGRLPTGWYPSAVALSADGKRLFVASAKGLGAGPNGVEVESNEAGTNASYIGNLLKGTVQAIDLDAVCASLPRLTNTVDANNGFTATAPAASSSVVPPAYGKGPSKQIKHVVFILKENRTYDQVLGDLKGTERDNRLALFGLPVTPNHHAVAQQFAHGDNYYDVGQDSFDGHFIIDTGHENEFDQKVHPTVWNANKLGPEGVYVSAPENLPLGGTMWNNLFRNNVSFRVYGEAVFLLNLGPTALVPPDQFSADPKRLLPQQFALENHYSLTYPSQITPSRPAFGDGNTDEDRADDFLRELGVLDASGTIPQFLFLWMTDDHTQGATPGAPTPEYLVARNDHALGRILEGLTHSRAWKDMAVFITEDDPQDGQDHVDAHRTFQLVLSPYVKRGHVSAVHHSNLSTLKTINLLLGVGPTSIQEAQATSLSDYFRDSPQLDPRYTTKPQQVPLKTNPPAKAAANADLRVAAELQDSVPPGLDKGGELLQEVLRVRHDGAAAAGEPGVPQLNNEAEHRLAAGSPAAVTLPTKTASCGAARGDARGYGGVLPSTGSNPLWLAAGLAALLAGLVGRRTSRRPEELLRRLG